METFVLAFQISSWVNDTFPMSIIDEAFDNKNTLDEVAIFLRTYDNLVYAFDNYVGEDDRNRLFNSYKRLYIQYTSTSRRSMIYLSEEQMNEIKETCKTEYVSFRNKIIQYGFEEGYSKSKHKPIILLYNGKVINENVSKKYYSTGDSWDSGEFNNNERLLAYRIHKFSQKEINTFPKIKEEGHEEHDKESIILYNEYVDFISNVAKKLGKSTIYIHNEIHHNRITDIISNLLSNQEI